MATSEVGIANRALQKLGAGRISSLSQDHPNARSMNAAYALVRDAEIRRYDWAFAIKRASIAADGDDTLYGDFNRFSLPNDYLRILLDPEDQSVVDWRIEGLHIVTKDAAPLEIRYIARIEDPNFYDSLFIEALACKLALETCEDVTGSTSKKESVKDDYGFAVAEAKRLGSIERAEQDHPDDEWLEARL
jgi:hypothetical protein